MKRLKHHIHRYTKHKILTLMSLAVLTLLISCDRTEKQTSTHTRLALMASNTKFTSIESVITEIEALVFVNEGSGYIFKDKVSATAITDAGNNVTTFQLAIANTSLPSKIHVITNASSTIANSNIQAGDSEALVKQKVNHSYSPDGITTGFPMWAEYEFLSGISANMPTTSINMYALPSLSRMDIITPLDPSNFSISSVQAYRVNNLMQVIPDSFTTPEQLSTPSIPAASSKINTTPITVTGNSVTEQLYLPESNAPAAANLITEATCIVVGGKYNNSTVDTYYRLDIEPSVVTEPIGKILRDRLYTFNITKVSSPGWETPDEAANNGSANIQAEVVDWSDSDMDIDLGNNYFVNLSSREIVLTNTIGSIGSSLIFTNVFDYTLQWSDVNSTQIGNTGMTLDNGTFRVTASRNIIIVDALQDNTGGSSAREDYFLILADRAHILMKITQLNQ